SVLVPRLLPGGGGPILMQGSFPELTPLVVGTSRDYTLQVYKADGTPYDSPSSPFDGTETLASTVGLGVDQSPLLTPTASWVDAAVAKFKVAFNDADTTGSVRGESVPQATANKAGRTASLGVYYLPMRQVGGTAQPPKVYGTLDDMAIYCTWIDRMEHP